jgi:hypothetical protein
MKRVRSLWQAALLVLCLTAFAQAEPKNFYGTATITSPASLGVIDLAFTLDVSGENILHDTSYIMLDKTLLFPACTVEPNCVGMGPRVKRDSESKLSATAFKLTTDDFTSVVSGRTVTRSVVLTSTEVSNNGASLKGNYKETITGLTPEPVEVTGTFFLVSPTVQTILVDMKDQNSDGCIDLNEIRASGTSSEIIEFSDMSQALHLYYNPKANLKICTTPSDPTGQKIIKDAFTEFSNTLKQK